MRRFFILLTTVVLSHNMQAQSAEASAEASAIDSVKAAVNLLFTAMRNADPISLKKAFADSAILQTIGRDKSGKLIVSNEAVSEFADFISHVKKDSADERISFETIKIDGPLAIVWTPYNFFYNGAFSHCGVNSFQLLRFEGVWKIQYLIDTRRRAGCKP